MYTAPTRGICYAALSDMTISTGCSEHCSWTHLWSDIVAATHDRRQPHAGLPATRESLFWLEHMRECAEHGTSAPADVALEVKL